MWTSSFTSLNILKASKAIGVELPDADIVLRTFKTTTPEQDEASKTEQHADGSIWKRLRSFFEAAVKDTAEVEARRLGASFYSPQVQNC
jgi:hypothetical protein